MTSLSKKSESYIIETPYEFEGEFTPILDKPYKPAAFQKHACTALNNDNSVLVLAHTGSGKTYVLEHAVKLGLEKGKKVILTFPIKVLSNQKYNDLCQIYSRQQHLIGIMTGDVKLNLDASVLIMTTEILKQMVMNDPKYLEDVAYVVFDEFHYINDASRGNVWETCINLIPKHIQMVFLSATFDNPYDFINWVGPLKDRPVTISKTKERPVPLNHYIFYENELHLIMNNKGEYFSDKNFIIEEYKKNQNHKKKMKSEINDFANWLSLESKVPALWFLLSRFRCQEYANKITDSLIDHEIRNKIENTFDKLLIKELEVNKVDYREIQEVLDLKKTTMKGIAYHHAGMLRICKEIIEKLFCEGHIKILFATETFAIGVNAPTKTVIFSEFNKYDEKYGNRMLITAEYLQMAGRAGRKGIDPYGECIIYPIYNNFNDTELRRMMTCGKLEISSKLNITPKTVLEAIYSNSLNPEIKLLDYFNNSLLGNEESNIKTGFQLQLKENKQKLYELNKIIFSDEENKLLEESKIIESAKNSNKYRKKKKYKNEINMREEKLRDNKIFKKILNIISKKKELETDIYNLEESNKYNVFNEEIYHSVRFLTTSSFFENGFNPNQFKNDLNSISKEHLSLKGIIASQVHYVNEIYFTEFILNILKTNDISPEELVSLLSIFITEKEKDTIISELDITKNCKKIIKDMKNLNKLILDTHLGWKLPYLNILNFEFMVPSYKWACKIDEKEIFENLEIYSGTFVSNMQRIYNILDELEKISNIVEFRDLETTCIKAKKLILRGIVNFDSLYLS